jgi:hypothetical protein
VSGASLDDALSAFRARGWARFRTDAATATWARAAAPEARRLAADPWRHGRDLRCGGTWFAGVNAFPNGPDAAAPDGTALGGPAAAFALASVGLAAVAWDRAQVSVVSPGYPRHGAEESAAAFRYRRDRDAAHVDGLLREGPERRRFLAESHLFILGVPLDAPAPGASPMVVWEGSHEVMRAAFRAALDGVPPEAWGRIDVTDAYHAARRRCFETCRRVALPAALGEAYVVHRLALHGVAPWTAPADAPPRAVAYFRPVPPAGFAPDWTLAAP